MLRIGTVLDTIRISDNVAREALHRGDLVLWGQATSRLTQANAVLRGLTRDLGIVRAPTNKMDQKIAESGARWEGILP